MSGTTTTTDTTAKPDQKDRGAIVVSVAAQATFLLAMAAACVIAKVNSDYTLLITLAGAAATNATAVVNYWIGSSAGSAKKTDILNAQQAPLAPSVVHTETVTTATPVPTPRPTPAP